MVDDLDGILAEAAAAASKVPKEFRQVAFAKAIDLLADVAPNARPRRVAGKRRSVSKKKPAPKAESGAAGAGKASRSGRPGAMSALRELAAGSFFTKRRTIPDIIEHLSTKKALKFEQPNLSGKLITLVRENVLDREKSADGIYEYWLK